MAANLELGSGVAMTTPKPVDFYGKFDAEDESTAVALALASIPSALRYIGRTALCNGVLYAFVNNISDAFFVPYSIGALSYTDTKFLSAPVSGSIGNTGAGIAFTTELKQIPLVFVNGIKVEVGFDAVVLTNNLCFFSPDGTTVREQLIEFTDGDELYWNPNYTNSFSLTGTDEINLVYNKI